MSVVAINPEALFRDESVKKRLLQAFTLPVPYGKSKGTPLLKLLFTKPVEFIDTYNSSRNNTRFRWLNREMGLIFQALRTIPTGGAIQHRYLSLYNARGEGLIMSSMQTYVQKHEISGRECMLNTPGVVLPKLRLAQEITNYMRYYREINDLPETYRKTNEKKFSDWILAHVSYGEMATVLERHSGQQLLH